MYSGEETLALITGELVNETILHYGDWGVLTTREYLGTYTFGESSPLGSI